MYLLVFVTLVISLIGLYGQVLSLQAARLASGQTVIAQAMIRWHSIAVEQARTTNITPLPGAAGCDLTSPGIVGVACNSGNGNVSVSPVNPPPGWSGQICGAAPPPCWNSLPVDYQINPYKFYSIYYSPAAGQSYVITFVPKPVVGPANSGFIALPGSPGAATQISITMGDLATQIRNSGLPPMSYGTVSGGQLTTQPVSNGGALAPLTYTTPPAVGNGAIGIISSP